MVSTYHNLEMVIIRKKDKIKDDIVLQKKINEYNLAKGGTDFSNQFPFRS